MDKALPIQHRPFNLEHARDGAPIATRIGSKAEILKWDMRGGDCPLLGFVDNGDGGEQSARWNLDGDVAGNFGRGCSLVMTPLGYIDGKPVFVGDELVHDHGTFTATPTARQCDFTGLRWPAPAKVYPTTNMTFYELMIAHNAQLDGKPNEFARSIRAVANAALRHAVDAGQVIESEKARQLVQVCGPGWVSRVDHLEVKNDTIVAHIGWTDCAPADRSARDMAIAEAVRASAISQFDAAVNCLAFLKATHVAKQIGALDLAAIIAGVAK